MVSCSLCIGSHPSWRPPVYFDAGLFFRENFHLHLPQAVGAQYIERHFTLDRTWKGTDHAASLEPQGLEKLTRDLHATHDALKFKADVGDSTDDFTPMEYDQRKKLKKPEMGI